MLFVKKLISISLVVLLSLQCLFKLGVITYYELNKDFIANVLCINKEKSGMTVCYGKCFLDKHLALANSHNKEKVPSKGSINLEIPNFILSENTCSFQIHREDVDILTGFLNFYRFDFPTSVFHPPALS